ncbi:MAG: ABC transporter ATP-binding protein [Desulfoprunum sp.]|uniref:ABC transporter ATP-binding protein n=1 Tax=Desulfoprunum sp. TaxID=2020866 RepID=UPI003C70AEEC
MTATVLHLHQLSKNFGSFTAVDDISLAVAAGEIYGFLGPNGAGKTTTIKMLAGLLQPSAGTVTICGHDLARAPLEGKRRTGYIPDRPFLYEKLTGDEYLRFIASLYLDHSPDKVLAEAGRFLELFDLGDWRHHLIEGYSHGMRQKLIMTSIFMLDQPLIVVDEPMVGLDPKSARIVKELFKSLAARGTAIFLSTHSMEIAEELCDRIGIIQHGRLTTTGTIADLRAQAAAGAKNLEDVFLELTGAYELQGIIAALRQDAGDRNLR